MTTQDIVEAILYLNQDTEKYFRACHIIDKNRPYKAKEHSEYPFINAFTNPHFIMIVSQRIHLYIIGEQSKGRTYNIINIEGFNADHLTLSKTELTKHIKETVSEKVFLPKYIDRIVYLYNDTTYIFNKTNPQGTIFNKNGEWSIGTDIYSMDNKRFKTNANDILKAIYSEF